MLICGLPASGKSTLARQLAPTIPAIRLDKDGWATQLGADVWDEEFRVRLEHQLWALTQDLLARGQSVILERGHGRELNGMRNDSGRERWGWESNCITSMRPWMSSWNEPSVAMRLASRQPRQSRGLTLRRRQ